MRVVIMSGSGEPREVLRSEEVDDLGVPQSDKVIVRIQKRVIHPADCQTIRGYLPVEVFTRAGVPGIDGVGVVEAIGSDSGVTADIRVGSRVIVYNSKGTWAERISVSAEALMPIPDDIEDAVACQLATNGITGLMLVRAAEQAIGHRNEQVTVLVTAANSGVAQSLIALIRTLGVKVIGLVRRDAHAVIVSKRFDDLTVIGTDRDDWQGAVRKAAGQAPLVAIDPIGGEMFTKLLALLAPRGTLITYGALDPNPALISSGFLTSFELTIRGCSAMGWASTTSAQRRVADFHALYDLARHSPQLFSEYREYPVIRVVEAIAAAEASPRMGATILVS